MGTRSRGEEEMGGEAGDSPEPSQEPQWDIMVASTCLSPCLRELRLQDQFPPLSNGTMTAPAALAHYEAS